MKYLGYFSKDNPVERSNPAAAATKMAYIANVLSRNEYTEIISASGVVGKITDYAHEQQINDKLSVRYFYSIGRKNAIVGKIGTLILHFQLLLYLLTKLNPKEPIIVYHSLGYMGIIRIAKKLCRFDLILEVEEIYADVLEDKKTRQRELSFFRCADAYIFPTELLSEVINIENKPEVIIHGTYQVEPDRKCNCFDDDLQENGSRIIHCVYAGTLDPRKGGAVAAAAAEYLPSNYHIHIIGFGSDSEIQNMKETIAKIASRSKAKVTYDGLLSGEEYIRFIQSCDIGLSTQDPNAAFNGTSFPSKILSYMANGLQVVSIRIPAIEKSAVGEYLHFYDIQNPENIASAIMDVELKGKYEGRKIISQLSNRFEFELRNLLEDCK